MKRLVKVIINKIILKEYLGEKEEISKSLSRFIDNSIEARKMITTYKNPCEVSINTNEDSISIVDNSGGINSSITDEDIFKIGNDNGENISGLGIKKSFFTLANKIEITSNRKECSRRLTLDINSQSEELMSQSETIKYNSYEVDGTKIYITDLNRNIKKRINETLFNRETHNQLGRIYSKFIDKKELILYLNGEKLEAKNIEAKKINSCKLLDKYTVNLYKGKKSCSFGGSGAGKKKDCSYGVDLYINDYMIYDGERSKEKVKWNLLNEHNYSFRDCIVEITYHGDKSKFYKEENILFEQVINFIKQNKSYFASKNVIIQYEVPIDKVEELKEYCGEDTAKAVGKRAFNKLYQDYKDSMMSNK